MKKELSAGTKNDSSTKDDSSQVCQPIAKPNVIRMGVCLDCGYEDEVFNFDKDSEYNEFTGSEHYYPVCPKCGGGVEVSLSSPCV